MIIRIKYPKLNSEQVVTVSRGKYSWTRNVTSFFYDNGMYDAATFWGDDLDVENVQRQYEN